MSAEIKHKFVDYLDQLGKNNDKSNDYLKTFIDKYGVVNRITKGEDMDAEDVFHDFFFFCTTKSFKSFCAVNVLIENEFFQDALIVLRPVYENYLVLSYLIKNPMEIDEILAKRLGFAAGKYEKVKDSKGRIVRGKLVDPETQEIFNYGISLDKIARNGMFEMDGRIHEILYKFLSEFVHPNMICSGAYIDNEKGKFSYEGSESFFIPMWMSVYLQTIILHLVSSFTIANKSMRKKLESICVRNSLQLIDFFHFLSEQSEDNKMKLAPLLIRLEIIKF
jgi:hypothetical protein